MVEFSKVDGKLSISEDQHKNSYDRLKQYKDDFNPNITDEQLTQLVDKGLEKIFSKEDEGIVLSTPDDVLSVVWALEYTNAVQGQVSPESFVKIVDNGKIYEALKKYNQEHNETVDKPKNQTKGEELRSYSYRRISTHSREYSGEAKTKSGLPLQYGIDIRDAQGSALFPGGKKTMLFHKENQELNNGANVLGVKYESSGCPPISTKSFKDFKYTAAEFFDHADQFISTRGDPGSKFISSILDVVKASLNIIPKLLNFVTLGKLDFQNLICLQLIKNFKKNLFIKNLLLWLPILLYQQVLQYRLVLLDH